MNQTHLFLGDIATARVMAAVASYFCWVLREEAMLSRSYGTLSQDSQRRRALTNNVSRRQQERQDSAHGKK